MNKIIWLARLLMHGKALTQKEIRVAWSHEDARGCPLARSTFYENLKRLRRDYGVNVVCRNGRYSLSGGTQGDAEALRLVAAGDDDNPLPSDDRILQTIQMWRPVISEAIGLQQMLRMTYVSPSRGSYETLLSPYCLHDVGELVYVVGHSSRHNECRTFALDRIGGLQLTPSHYRVPDGFSEEAYFGGSVGAYAGPQLSPTTVVFEADAALSRYLRERPIHKSQREMPGQAFCIKVAVTRDLIDRFLSFGPSLTVREPAALVAEIKGQLTDALQHYSNPSSPK